MPLTCRDDGISRTADLAITRLALSVAVAAAATISAWNASFTSSSRWWAIAIIVLAALGFGATWPHLGSVIGRPLLAAGNLATLAVVYSCVPETDHIVAVAATAAIVVLFEFSGTFPVTASWYVGVVFLVVWAGLFGATGRPSALVGALFAIGITPAIGTWIAVADLCPPRARLVYGCAVIIAGCNARTGGIATTLSTSLRWGAVWMCALVVIMFAATWRTHEANRSVSESL